MLHALLSLVCIDIRDLSEEQRQQRLNIRVCQDIESNFMMGVHFDLRFHNIEHFSTDRPQKKCIMTFRHGNLNAFIMFRNNVGNFRICFLPHSATDLQIIQCDQTFVLQTRHFPRSALNVNLSSNRLVGALSLQALPRQLITLNLGSNNLTGYISMGFLPESLKHLILHSNPLYPGILYYGDLPISLSRVGLERTHVRKISPISREFNRNDVFSLKPL